MTESASLTVTPQEFRGQILYGLGSPVSLGHDHEDRGKDAQLRTLPGPLGVRGRNSDNGLIEKQLGWHPTEPLVRGLEQTYPWIRDQVHIASP